MSLKIVLPRIEGEGKKVKDLIIYILSFDFPLTVKQIHHKILKEHGLNVTYQAVHKTVLQLLGAGVLEKTEKNFRISPTWISSVKSFINNIELKYSKEKNLLKKLLYLSDSDSHVVVNKLNSIKELDDLLLSFMSQEKEFYSYVKHVWFPLIHTEKIIDYSSSTKTEKIVVCSDKYPLDKYCINYLKRLGEKVGVSKEFDDTYSFSIYGNYVVQSFFEKTLMDSLEEIYSKTQSIKKLDLVEFNKKFFDRKTEIILLTAYNPVLANFLKEKLKKHLE